MKHWIAIVLLLFMTACKSSDDKGKAIPLRSHKQMKISSVKSFNAFFERFQTDAVTQLSSIKFPLKTVMSEDDGNTVKMINKSEWLFCDFKKITSGTVNLNVINETKVEAVFGIEDTGVHTVYTFEYVGQKWWLTSIRDEST